MSSTNRDNDSVSKNGRTGQAPLPTDAIIIDEIKIGSGRPVRGGRLFGCYFVQDGDRYNFFDREGGTLQSQIQDGVPFNFGFPDNSEPDGWQMTVSFEKKDLTDVAHGNWNFHGNDDNDNDDDGAEDEDGTFHAQAGGGGTGYKKASSATAY